MDQESKIPVPIWFMCKFCSSVFPSVERYWGHKVEKHSSKFLRNRAIIFEESNLELAETETEQTDADANSCRAVTEPNFRRDVDDSNKLEGIHTDADAAVKVNVKQEPQPEPKFFPDSPIAIILNSTTLTTSANQILSTTENDPGSILELTYGQTGDSLNNSEIKAEWVQNAAAETETEAEAEYETHDQENSVYSTNLVVFMPQPSEDYNIHFYDETEASLGSDVQGDLCQDPLENGPPLNDELTPAAFGTGTSTTLPADHQFYNEDENEVGVDIICLDDTDDDDNGDPASASKTTNASNNFIRIHPELQCKICSKQHTSEAELRIHVTLCQLSQHNRSTRNTLNRNRNRNRNRDRSRHTNNPAPGVSSVNCEYSVDDGDGDGDGSSMLKCHICCRLIKDCNLKRHLKTHNIFVQDQKRKFACQICGAAFKTNALVRRHLRVHSDDRPFACPFPSCHSTFKYQRNLRHHVKTLHPER